MKALGGNNRKKKIKIDRSGEPPRRIPAVKGADLQSKNKQQKKGIKRSIKRRGTLKRIGLPPVERVLEVLKTTNWTWRGKSSHQIEKKHNNGEGKGEKKGKKGKGAQDPVEGERATNLPRNSPCRERNS